jgi:hypothetical protein
MRAGDVNQRAGIYLVGEGPTALDRYVHRVLARHRGAGETRKEMTISLPEHHAASTAYRTLELVDGDRSSHREQHDGDLTWLAGGWPWVRPPDLGPGVAARLVEAFDDHGR